MAKEPENRPQLYDGGASVVNGHMEIYDRVVVTGMGMVMRPITERVYTPPVFRF